MNGWVQHAMTAEKLTKRTRNEKIRTVDPFRFLFSKSTVENFRAREKLKNETNQDYAYTITVVSDATCRYSVICL